MKLAIDCHHIEDQEGIKRYVLALLKEWDALEYLKNRENQILCYLRKELPEMEEFPRGIETIIMESRSTLFFQQVRLPMELSRDKPDVFFSPSYLLPLFYPRAKKSVVTIHDIVFSTHPEDFDWHSRFDKWYIPNAAYMSAKRATFTLTPSEFSRREIKRRWKINPAKIFVTPLAGNINFAKAHPLLPRQDFILFVGSLFNRRHASELIQAFYHIVKIQPALRLILVGKDRTNPPQHIDALIEKTNYRLRRKAIERLEKISDDDLLRLYYSARALVLLSDYEGFGLPVLEALSCGLPVLLSKRGSLPEIAGDAASYVNDPANVHEIKKKLLILLTDGSLRRSLKSKGLQQAQTFNWTKTAKETWQILTLAAKI